MLFWFCVYFTLFVACLTLFSSLDLYLWVVLSALVFSVFYLSRRGFELQKILKNTLLLLFWAIIAYLSVTISSDKLNNNIIDTEMEMKQAVFSGSIDSARVGSTYVLNSDGWELLLRWIDKDIAYWERLLVSGYYIPQDYHFKLDTISFPSLLTGGFDYNIRLWTKWYVWDLYVDSTISLWQKHSPIQSLRHTIKSKISNTYSNTTHQWLLHGMLVGDISKLSKDSYQLFVDSGLVHLVAVSGWNIIMLVVFLRALLFFLPRFPRTVFSAIGIVWYVFITWFDASVTRALIMWVLAILALLSWRVVKIERLILFSWIFLLLWRPFSLVYDLWFLLSYFALFGVIYIPNIVTKKLSIPRALNIPTEYLLSSFWASLFVLPILLFFVWSNNVIWFVSNVFVLPIIGLIMAFWWLSLLFSDWFFWEIFAKISSHLLAYVVRVAEISQEYWVYISTESAFTRRSIVVLFFLLYCAYVFRYKETLEDQ